MKQERDSWQPIGFVTARLVQRLEEKRKPPTDEEMRKVFTDRVAEEQQPA